MIRTYQWFSLRPYCSKLLFLTTHSRLWSIWLITWVGLGRWTGCSWVQLVGWIGGCNQDSGFGCRWLGSSSATCFSGGTSLRFLKAINPEKFPDGVRQTLSDQSTHQVISGLSNQIFSDLSSTVRTYVLAWDLQRSKAIAGKKRKQSRDQMGWAGSKNWFDLAGHWIPTIYATQWYEGHQQGRFASGIADFGKGNCALAELLFDWPIAWLNYYLTEQSTSACQFCWWPFWEVRWPFLRLSDPQRSGT